MSGLESLYQELILEHSKRPHGKGTLDETEPVHSATSHQRNPICGDEITLRVGVDGGAIVDVVWDGAGCSISQASASMLVSLIEESAEESGEQMSRAAASELIDHFRESMRSRGKLPLDEEEFGDAAALSGVSKFTARVKCAMLPWVALEDALARA